MTRTALTALLSHWRRAPLQLFTLIAGLALATGLWSGVQAINAEARASYDAAAATLGEGRFARIEAAAKYVPLDRLAISPQCGFASTVAGNPVTLEDEIEKLRLLVDVASEVWG